MLVARGRGGSRRVVAAGSQGGVAGLVVSYGDAGQVFLAGVTALAAKDLAFG